VVSDSVRHAARLITQIENGVPAARAVLAELLPHCGSAEEYAELARRFAEVVIAEGRQ
jgi:putative protein kinase ArgK-like GTPase of G3E family